MRQEEVRTQGRELNWLQQPMQGAPRFAQERNCDIHFEPPDKLLDRRDFDRQDLKKRKNNLEDQTTKSISHSEVLRDYGQAKAIKNPTVSCVGMILKVVM